MKPTSRPISHCARSRLNPFLDACHAIALQPNLQRSARHWLVGWSTLRPRLTRHPASPRPHAANEENAALRKAIEDADYECGVGLLRLNQLDLVTVVALPATVRRSATVPSPQEQLISQSGLPQCVRLSFTGREEEQLCLQHCPWTTTQPGRGQRLAGGDDKHSQPNAELAKGRQVRMPCAPVDSTPWMDLERHRVALPNKNSRHGSTMSTIRTTAHTCYCRRRYTI